MPVLSPGRVSAHCSASSLLRARLAVLLISGLGALAPALAADLSKEYEWKPVRIGAGGFVTGLVLHPQDPAIRYCRTDVGNAYRWDEKAAEWFPMVVRTETGGLPAAAAVAPSRGGVSSLAVDPRDKNVVLMAMPFKYSGDLKLPGNKGTVFRSEDGGRSFVGSDLNVKLVPNGKARNIGERLAIDPNDSKIVFIGSQGDGLWKSVNGGLNWTHVTGGGAPAEDAELHGVRFDKVDDKRSILYAVVTGKGIFQSADGGANWQEITAGKEGADKIGNVTIDAKGNLYAPVSLKPPEVWKKSRDGVWSTAKVSLGSSGNNINSIAVDPANPERLFAIGSGGAQARSLDGGQTWQYLGRVFSFANSVGWMPQHVKGSPDSWRSNGGIYFDTKGNLWAPQGNEGVLTTRPSDDNSESAENPLRWTITSKGIEEFVVQDVVIPQGSGDRAVVSTEDATAIFVDNPDEFTAKKSNLQDQLISNGLGLAACPNDGNFIAVASADVNRTGSGRDYSGYSTDGGRTWKHFASSPEGAKSGNLAISRREGWGEGEDHIVWLPTQNRPPFWSHDGGKTWTMGQGFPTKENGTLDKISAYWIFALKQRTLIADPAVADRFLVYFPWKGYYLSEDGGKNWSLITNSNLPDGGHHGQLAANPHVPGEFWFADGWEGGLKHGLWVSSDRGLTYTKVEGVENAVTLAVGKGEKVPGAIYFYGRLTGDPAWGVFRSEDKGQTWDRLSYYPTGLIDVPSRMAASQDTAGLIYIGFNGNTCVYGKPRPE
jgi:photosystem II stability/assembly factor-like uncharacterized protein